MSCVYLGSCGDSCTMFGEGERNNPLGCDVEGNCRVQGDPDPNVGCDTYEGLEVCIDCGADENIDGEECECDT